MCNLKRVGWEYDFKHPWMDIIAWCKESFGETQTGNWEHGFCMIWFYDEAKLNWFLLRWS